MSGRQILCEEQVSGVEVTGGKVAEAKTAFLSGLAASVAAVCRVCIIPNLSG